VAGHGQHRWQQGYHLRETIREWGHFHLCLQSEIDDYARADPAFDANLIGAASRMLTEFCTDGASTSAAEYFELHRIEAAGHLRELEHTLARIRDFDRQRTDLWRQAAHDLRGSLSPVVDATTGLTMANLPQETRDAFLGLLQQSLTSLRALVEEVASLARLEAGAERREVTAFDVAVELTDLCNGLQPLAKRQGLYLSTDGPARLPVQGDAVKTRRIVQNLVINALKYTYQGGVTVRWAEMPEAEDMRWTVSIEDTGPGIEVRSRDPLTNVLRTDAEGSPAADARVMPAPERASSAASTAASPASAGGPVERGEGIGLSIVKRLCELLEATLELKTGPDAGTTFRVSFPRAYPKDSTPKG
jgi:signal transduction histidine kinase